MKIIGCLALFYGLDTVELAIKSVIDYCDRLVVLYALAPSHGQASDAPALEHAADLYEACKRAAGDKLHWYADTWEHEGKQRDTVYTLAPDADYIITIDADEIYAPGLVPDMLAFAMANPPVRQYRVPFIHAYRNWHSAILHDPAYPIRMVNPRIEGGENTVQTDKRVFHVGYAQSQRIIKGKLDFHGHKNEFRRDCDWFQDIYLNENRTTDLHPVGSDAWNVEAINPRDYLPGYALEHPWAKIKKGIIS